MGWAALFLLEFLHRVVGRPLRDPSEVFCSYRPCSFTGLNSQEPLLVLNQPRNMGWDDLWLTRNLRGPSSDRQILPGYSAHPGFTLGEEGNGHG